MIKEVNIALLSILFIILLNGCLKPHQSNYLDYQTKVELRFPLKGESFIYWGGRTMDQNDHASEKDQRFALDIVSLKPGIKPPSKVYMEIFGVKTYEGDPKLNNSYYCFGQEVVSPANGQVVEVIDAIHDNVPGKLNQSQALGNYVIIDHGNNEFSMIAHLKFNSINVKAGDQVDSGEIIALVGNSGNSSEPHLHYHLQNTGKWFKGEGLPAQFHQYMSNGMFVKRGEPVRGEIIISR